MTLLSNKSVKLTASSLLLGMALSACGPTLPAPVTPHSLYVPDTDAQTVPAVDYDAYTVSLPSTVPGALVLNPGGGDKGPNGEIIAPLRLGQPAPFNGVLFNSPALAYLEVEFRATQTQCLIERQTDVALVRARAQADIEHLQTMLSAAYQTQTIIVRGRDEEYNRLVSRYNTLQNNSSHVFTDMLWLGGGMVIGVGLMGVVSLFTR